MYTEAAKNNRLLQNKFEGLSNLLGTATVQANTQAIYEEQLSTLHYLHWLDTKNISYLEQSTESLNYSIDSLNLFKSLITTEMNAFNETAKYELLANQNETSSSKINMGLLLMNMSLFFFSMSILPLKTEMDETEKKYKIFTSFGKIIFLIGLSMWSLGFIPIFPLMF